MLVLCVCTQSGEWERVSVLTLGAMLELVVMVVAARKDKEGSGKKGWSIVKLGVTA